MEAALRQLVWQRAQNRCEYCGLPQDATPYVTFHVEHILPRQHGGRLVQENLALACQRCNRAKGPNLATMDPEFGEPTRLFDPRRDLWSEHFSISQGLIYGLTAIGRGTAQLLKMNHPDRVRLRRSLH